MSDLVERLRNCYMDTKRMLPCKLQHEAADEIERLQREAKHWKANHDNRVEAARILIERDDLPFERVAAYQRHVELQEERDALKKDAERYRALVNFDSPTVCAVEDGEWVPIHPQTINATIDAAMEKTK